MYVQLIRFPKKHKNFLEVDCFFVFCLKNISVNVNLFLFFNLMVDGHDYFEIVTFFHFKKIVRTWFLFYDFFYVFAKRS